MGKRVLTSTGKVIDLDRGEGVESIPPESLAMEKHSYGAYAPSFSLILNGMMTSVRTGYGQFYDTQIGERRLLTEMQEMKLFPKAFPVNVGQNYATADIYCTIYMTINGIQHKVTLTYDRDHPNYQINASIDYPRLSPTKMVGHWYSDGRPCYIHAWNRSWTMLKTATQVRFWLEDYYGDKGYDRTIDDIMRESQRIIDEIDRKSSFWRSFRL